MVDLYHEFRTQPPAPPPSGLRVLEPTDWIEVPLIPDPRDPDGLPRKVFGRITRTGNLEVGIEALSELLPGPRSPTTPPSLPGGTTVAERRAYYAEHAPRPGQAGAERTGTGSLSRAGELPESEAPNKRIQALILEQRARLGKPLIEAKTYSTELPLHVPGRATPTTTSPARHAFATALVPAAALHAVDYYIGKAVRTDPQRVEAIGYALFTAKATAFPQGRYVTPSPAWSEGRPELQQTTARELYRSGVTGESFVPGTFPPGFKFPSFASASTVPVTTDTVAAVEYFVRNKFHAGAARGRGVYRSYSPPRRNRIANDLRAAGWRDAGRTPGFGVVLYAPPPGAPPAA